MVSPLNNPAIIYWKSIKEKLPASLGVGNAHELCFYSGFGAALSILLTSDAGRAVGSLEDLEALVVYLAECNMDARTAINNQPPIGAHKYAQ